MLLGVFTILFIKILTLAAALLRGIKNPKNVKGEILQRKSELGFLSDVNRVRQRCKGTTTIKVFKLLS